MDTDPAAQNRQAVDYDPTFLHARKEAAIIFGVWATALLWAVPYCYFNGYTALTSPGELHTVFGVPSWVFWGVAFPWLLADLFTVWFCFFYMADDDLGEERVEANPDDGPRSEAEAAT